MESEKQESVRQVSVMIALVMMVAMILFFVRDCQKRDQAFLLERLRLELQCEDSE